MTQAAFESAAGTETGTDTPVVPLSKEQIKAIAKHMLSANSAGETDQAYWYRQLATARWLAHTLFVDKRWGAYPYPYHLEQVASEQRTRWGEVAGWLHDLVEDIDGWELEDLEEIGFNVKVLNIVDHVTKRDGEKYFEAVARCGEDLDSASLKMDDNARNSQMHEYHRFPDQRQHHRADKYWISRRYLQDRVEGRCAPGTPVIVWATQNEHVILNPQDLNGEGVSEARARFYDLLFNETDAATLEKVQGDLSRLTRLLDHKTGAVPTV
jgi:hypothetical protein